MRPHHLLSLPGALLVALTLFTSDAPAAPPPADLVQAAVEVGQRVMPTPCEPEIAFVEFDAAHGARADVDSCEIHINTAADLTWAGLCGLMVHERGHIAGLPHSEDPASFMHAQILNVHPACHELPPMLKPTPGR